MGLNVSTSMGFENRNFLRNAAREILQRSGASKEATSKIVDTLIFDKTYLSSEQKALQAAAQSAFSESLKISLKNFKNKKQQKPIKTPVFGTLWEQFSKNEQSNNFELLKFEIKEDAENIFAAA